MSIENSIIQLRNVALSYRQRQAFFRHKEHSTIKGISFDIYRGETLGIVGRNGCGKSTLLKMLAGIIEPDLGNVIKNDISTSLLTLAAGFDNELSGRDNALLSSMLLGHSKEVALENMSSIESFSELGKYFYEPVKTYSSGMRARLGFSTAITMHADVILIDEVLGVGDANFRKKAEEAILSKINSEQTVVFVSHSINQVKRLCQRVLWLEDGLVKLIGNTVEVTEQYSAYMKETRFVSTK